MKRTLLNLSITVSLMFTVLTTISLAQDTQPPTNNQTWYVMLYSLLGGPVISWIVAFLKNVTFVKDHAKLVAFFVSILATVIPVLAHAPFAADGVGMVIVGILTQFTAAIGTHEVVNKAVSSGT